MPHLASSSAFFRRWRRPILLLTGVYGLWLLGGFFLLPALVRPRIEGAASRALKRPVTVAKLHFNPITFGASLEGLRVAERGGGDWITLRRLYLNHQFWRLLGRTMAFSSVEVDGLVDRKSVV